jgi:Fur family ferric uptake transcriptional regulator
MQIKPCKHESHKHGAKDLVEEAIHKMRDFGLRVTSPRIEILKALAATTKPLSTEEVFSSLGKKSGDLVTVYRALATLEEAEILRRHDFGDGVKRYAFTGAQHHHHYVICRNCGSVEPFDDCSFEIESLKTLKKRGYTKIQHMLEVFAECPKCS